MSARKRFFLLLFHTFTPTTPRTIWSRSLIAWPILPAATAEVLERMFEASTPNFDMDDNIKKLLRKLYDKGYHAEVLRCVERLRKTLPGMLEFYKTLGARVPKA